MNTQSLSTGGWVRWHSLQDIEISQRRMIGRLVRAGHIEPDHPITRCNSKRCYCRLAKRSAPIATLERCAACKWAQAKFERFGVPVLAEQLGSFGELHLVTLVDLRHRVEPSHFPECRCGTWDRRGRRYLAAAQRMSRMPIAAVMVIDVDEAWATDDRLWMRPHMHLVVAGATQSTLEASFILREWSGDDAAYKSVHIQPIINLGGVRYACKIMVQGPECTRRDKRGRPQRSSSHAACEIAHDLYLLDKTIGQAIGRVGFRLGESAQCAVNYQYMQMICSQNECFPTF